MVNWFGLFSSQANQPVSLIGLKIDAKIRFKNILETIITFLSKKSIGGFSRRIVYLCAALILKQKRTHAQI
ncbi:MAG TPA: hypothetical protein DEB18_13345 [Leeuwenhoekiella sp.]|nr:hypothetical protein [Leeuwenhoekiella sp.]